MPERHSEDMIAELSVIREDLRAVEESYIRLQQRVGELVDLDVEAPELTFFLRWSGKDAIMGSMELGLHHLRDLVKRYEQAIEDQQTRENVQAGATVINLPGSNNG